jgi:hypothetical protein
MVSIRIGRRDILMDRLFAAAAEQPHATRFTGTAIAGKKLGDEKFFAVGRR